MGSHPQDEGDLLLGDPGGGAILCRCFVDVVVCCSLLDCLFPLLMLVCCCLLLLLVGLFVSVVDVSLLLFVCCWLLAWLVLLKNASNAAGVEAVKTRLPGTNPCRLILII